MIDVLFDADIRISDAVGETTHVISLPHRLPTIMPVGTTVRLPAPQNFGDGDGLYCVINKYLVANDVIIARSDIHCPAYFTQSDVDVLIPFGYSVCEDMYYSGIFDEKFAGLYLTKPNHDFEVCLNNSENELSGRARNVLHNSGIQSFSQLTKWNLSQLRHCGKQTVDEILAWAKSKTSE